jgi:hypothetical protein
MGGKAHASSVHWRSGEIRKRRLGQRQAIEAIRLRAAGHPSFKWGIGHSGKVECFVPDSFGTVVAGRLTMRCRRTQLLVTILAGARIAPSSRAAELNR